jgi:hypothetical protein
MYRGDKPKIRPARGKLKQKSPVMRQEIELTGFNEVTSLAIV